MGEIKFQFKLQPFQTEAAASAVRVFSGQQNRASGIYRGTPEKLTERGAELTDATYKNSEIELRQVQLLKNIRAVQAANNIECSDDLAAGPGAVSLDVEMETGTGKTYVYIKTMFELHRAYGWSKYIVVVPSIAIREGVMKCFEITREHFMEQYGVKACFFAYDSSNLHRLVDFSQHSGISVMIINTQAFNTAMSEDKSAEGRGGSAAARIIYSSRDEFGSRRPIDVIKATRPIIILDEPQKMGGAATRNALEKNFEPLFSLNYSATHKTSHNLVYVLDALDAYRRKLVKRIEIKGFELKNLGGADGYMYLAAIVLDRKKPPRARLEFDIKRGAGIRRVTRLLHESGSLFAESGGLDGYRGISVAEVDPRRGVVTFSNGQTLSVGEAAGNVSEDDVHRIQIRETVMSHFDKEEKLFERGIKCLSLFFIDEVAKYRRYDDGGAELPGLYGKIFEEEYLAELGERLARFGRDYQAYLRGIDAAGTHRGYFSVDRKGRAVNSEVKRGSEYSDDISAYNLILKDKERLLSFEEPTRFIFSHSALREGWDNPNIFQICALKRSDNSTAKRQEIGRGLRLCVNSAGERQDSETCGESRVHRLNVLTVIANESYAGFVADLQSEIRSDLRGRPTAASAEYFTGKSVQSGGGTRTLTAAEAAEIYDYLVRGGYADDTGTVTDAYRVAAEAGSLAPMNEELQPFAENIHRLVQGIFCPGVLNAMASDGRETKTKENPASENGQDFSELRERGNKRCAYTVEFEGKVLIDKSVVALNRDLCVARLSYALSEGIQDSGNYSIRRSETKNLDRSQDSFAKYDLLGKLSAGTNLTRRTVAAILEALSRDKMKLFAVNPEEFIAKTVSIINYQKAAVAVEHIPLAPEGEEVIHRIPAKIETALIPNIPEKAEVKI